MQTASTCVPRSGVRAPLTHAPRARRRSQCERCLHELNLLQPAVASLAALPPPAGPRAKRLAEALSALLAAVATAQDKGGRGGVRRG